MTKLILAVFGLFISSSAIGSSDIHYTAIYFIVTLYLFLCARTKDLTSYLFFGFVFLYFSMSALNISTYRGIIDTETLYVYFTYFVVASLPLVFTDLRVFIFRAGVIDIKPSVMPRTEGVGEISPNFWLALKAHLAVVYIVLGYLLATKGNIFINQELRTGIPVWSGYVVRSSAVIPVVLYSCMKSTADRKLFLWSLICIIPAIFIGARGTVVVLMLAAFIGNKILVNNMNRASNGGIFFDRKTLLIVVSAFFVIVSGFYLRRMTGELYALPSELVEEYFTTDSFWVYIIMPFYLGFRETLGITNIIVTRDLFSLESGWLFFSELLSFLPGEQLAPGGVLGDIVGRVGKGGLTPGIVGGLYIDLKMYGALILLLLVLLVRALLSFAIKKPKYIALYVVAISQLIHLYHRGFLKPEYVTYMGIVFFYCSLFCKNQKPN